MKLDEEKLESPDISREMFEKFRKLREQKDAEGIRDLVIAHTEGDQLKEMQAYRLLVRTGDFSVKGNEFYLNGVSHPLPVTMVNALVALVRQYWDKEKLQDDEKYLTLKGFWVWVKNLYEETGNLKILYEDEFVKSLLEGYEKDLYVFQHYLVDKITMVKKNAKVPDYSGLTLEELKKAIEEMYFRKQEIV